jgi:Cu2+-exporting ATPase
MFLGAATYLGLNQGPLHQLFQSASFATATLSALIGGSYFVERALAGVRRGVLHLDLPIAVGMGLAYLGSALSHWFGGGSAAYFDTVSVFIALMLAGRLVQERLVEQNRRQLLENDGARALIARRLRQDRTEFVPCDRIEPGDRLLICPGEIVPVSARLESESASCSLDWITGESEPRQIEGGASLVAGAINVGASAFEAVALAPFQSSDLDLLLRSDDAAKQRLAGDFWDRTARLYVLGVLLATAGSVVLWALRGAGLVQILDVATAVLVVTCPCAFGIAVPLAYELGVAGLRARGLFVRDAGFFDRAARVRRIVFDKTGTLTTGLPELCDESALDALSAPQRVLLYSLVARSNHPKSTAVARALAARYPELAARLVHSRELPGRGLECSFEGVLYRFGDPAWALREAKAASGPVFSADGELLLELPLRELARPHAREELAELARSGYELWIASGDQGPRVARMAEALGAPADQALGDLTPQDKLALIERLDRRDTLMLGDGINDGPALSRAYCSGTPAIDRPFVPSRADFYFLTPGLGPVRLSLAVARAVRSTVHKALWFAALYNVGAVALAYAGLMRPWLAAVLMPASSVAVLLFTAHALSTRRPLWRS